MGVAQLSINGNSSVGLFGLATDEYCLMGKEVSKKNQEAISKALDVPVYAITLAGTSLIGVFAYATDNILLIPSIVLEREKKELDKLKIKYEVIKTDNTALGNLIGGNHTGTIISHIFTDSEKKQIEDALGIHVKVQDISETEAVGSEIVANNRGCLLYRDAFKEEIELVEKTLKVPVELSTLNFANPYVKSGIICNNKGMVVGNQSTGPEVSNAYEILGFLEDENNE